MINAIIIFIFAVFIIISIKSYIKHLKGESSCCGGGSRTVKIQPSDKNRANYKYSADMVIPDIMCSNCALKISNALNAHDGIWAEKINPKAKKAHILLKAEIADEAVKDLIQQAGYSIQNYCRNEL